MKQVSGFRQFSIEFIDAGPVLLKYHAEEKLYLSEGLTVESYFRLLVPELLAEYAKAVYLDCDIICTADIASLYDIDLGSRLFAAVRDSGVSWYYSPHTEEFRRRCEVLLSLSRPDEYFCAGVMVFNNEQFGKQVLENIKHREGIGLKFILVECLKAWITRDKK